MNEMKPVVERWVLVNCTSLNSFTFWKVSVKLHKFRVPGYKGFRLPWVKWNPSLNDDFWPTIVVGKTSLSENNLFKLRNFRVSLYMGVPYHEWNDTVGFPTMTEIIPIL